MTYKYLGDRYTSPSLKGAHCIAVRRPDGKCIRGKNGSMLVEFESGKHVIIGRLLRKTMVDKDFCWKRIGEQEDYINELNNRKSKLNHERYFELLQSAVERKDYFFKQLLRLKKINP